LEIIHEFFTEFLQE